jgi:amidohydrolase
MPETTSELLARVNLSSPARAAHESVVATRRELHQHPETGLEEYETAKFIEARLDALGIPHQRCTPTGVTGLLDGAGAGPVVMLRADIDALPVTEENEHEYVSRHPGRMHACGHDAHMAMLLGVAERLKREGFSAGRVKLVFQPGEEGHHGAEKMIAAGVMENPKVDLCYGQHVWAAADIGSIMIAPGPVMAAVDRLEITVSGKGTHAAYPHGGTDCVYASAQIITALQSIVSRNVDPLRPAVVTIAQINAGTAHNIIPPECRMVGTVRAFDEETHAILRQRIPEIVKGVAQTLGCEAQVNYITEHSATVNDADVAALVREEAVAIVGEQNVSGEQRTMGAEDMSDYLKAVPGAYVFIGARNAAKGAIYPHHHPKFSIDEDALAIGAELMYRVAQRLLRHS